MSKDMNEILQMPADKRHAYLLTQVTLNKQIWILTDEHGCVMLNSDDDALVELADALAMRDRGLLPNLGVQDASVGMPANKFSL